LFSAGISQFFSDGSLEEPFAALAAVDTVVLAGGPVAADAAEVFGAAQRVIRRVGDAWRG